MFFFGPQQTELTGTDLVLKSRFMSWIFKIFVHFHEISTFKTKKKNYCKVYFDISMKTFITNFDFLLQIITSMSTKKY